VLGRPHVFVEQEDYTEIKPITSEIIWTYEFGYSGFIGKMARVTFDLYYSEYSDFVSDLTWITPIVMDTSNGFDNYEILGIIASSEHDNIDIGADNISGTDDDSKILDPLHDDRIELTLTNINYGQVYIHGFDMSIYAFLTKRITTEVNASYLGMQEFYNPLTRGYDPINAPKFKINSSLSYESTSGITANINFRYIPEFKWSAGVFYGTIKKYFITDLSLGYKINPTFSVLGNITNIFNDYHSEIVGGPELGRHFKFKVSAKL
jgi:outer membrane receptor protein involved in Fe transport